jgi:nickel transport protein
MSMVPPRAFRRWSPLAAGAILAVLAAPAARAHGIESTLEKVGDRLISSPYQLESRFSTGQPARQATVRMVSPDGTASVDLGETNAEGRLTFTLPARARADWEVQVDAGPGHRDYIELPGINPPGVQGKIQRMSQPLARTLGSLGAVALLGTMAGLLLHRPRS